MNRICSLMCVYVCFHFFFKQKTAYEMRISDWSSDVCSSDLRAAAAPSNWWFADRRRWRHARAMTMIDPDGSVYIGSSAKPEYIRLPYANRHGQIGRASCRESVCQYV